MTLAVGALLRCSARKLAECAGGACGPLSRRPSAARIAAGQFRAAVQRIEGDETDVRTAGGDLGGQPGLAHAGRTVQGHQAVPG